MEAEDSDDDRTRSYVYLTAGTQIGHYRIVDKIGAGGMGEVYLTNHILLIRCRVYTAIGRLDSLLSVPSMVSVDDLETSPDYAPCVESPDSRL